MKKTVSAVLILLLVLSVVAALIMFGQLSDVKEENASLKATIGTLEKDKDALAYDLDTSQKALKALKSEFDDIRQVLEERETELQTLDERLSGDGTLIQRVDQLIADNDQWRQELNKVSSQLNDIEKELEADQGQDAGSTNDTSLRKAELEAVVIFIENRVTELEEAASALPGLSLERMMIQQEVGFLNAAIEDIEEVISKMNN